MNNLSETSNVQPNLLVAFMQRADEVTAVVYLTTGKRDRMWCVVAVGENFGSVRYGRSLLLLTEKGTNSCVTSESTRRVHQVKSTQNISFSSLLLPLHVLLWSTAKKEMMLQHQTVHLHERTLICFYNAWNHWQKTVIKNRHIFCFLHCRNCCHEIHVGVCRRSLLTCFKL